jgi:hypothetical protein
VILKPRQVLLDGVLGEVVEAEFHFASNPLLSPKQHKETLTGWNFERPGHT